MQFLLIIPMLTSGVWADTAQVAVASNFSKPMQQIVAAFEESTGHKVKLSFGSSGKFVAQISYGAPFDVFLSADTDKPQRLINMGLADAESRFTYAQGRLALWSADTGYIDADGATLLDSGDFKHLALAEAKLAPYGQAAQEVLAHLQLTETLQGRLVTGENISQTYQFVSTANAELGFVAASQIYRAGELSAGSAWLVPENYYSPIKQDAVLLNRGRDNVAAQMLMAFLRSAVAMEIMVGFAYAVPDPDSTRLQGATAKPCSVGVEQSRDEMEQGAASC